jgi:rhodanese-related sulfurtransferase
MALAVSVLALPGCAYITGEAVTVPAPAPAPTTATVINVTPAGVMGILFAGSTTNVPTVIDVRTPQEYAGGHITFGNILNIDFTAPSFKNEVGKLDKTKTYVVYCRSGARSAAASQVMAELGFQHIFNMTGGFTDWQAQGFPVTK